MTQALSVVMKVSQYTIRHAQATVDNCLGWLSSALVVIHLVLLGWMVSVQIFAGPGGSS